MGQNIMDVVFLFIQFQCQFHLLFQKTDQGFLYLFLFDTDDWTFWVVRISLWNSGIAIFHAMLFIIISCSVHLESCVPAVNQSGKNIIRRINIRMRTYLFAVRFIPALFGRAVYPRKISCAKGRIQTGKAFIRKPHCRTKIHPWTLENTLFPT